MQSSVTDENFYEKKFLFNGGDVNLNCLVPPWTSDLYARKKKM